MSISEGRPTKVISRSYGMARTASVSGDERTWGESRVAPALPTVMRGLPSTYTRFSTSPG